MKKEEVLIEVKDLTVSYRKVRVVRNVSFDVRQGEVLGIAGESGSGKTTLLRSLMRIENREIHSMGNIRFQGEELTETTQKELRKLRGNQISMIPQNAMLSMDPTCKISSLVNETLCTHGQKIGRKESDQIASSIMSSLLLDDPERILMSYPFELSGGMAQRVAIAVSILNRPKLLLGDEPTSALDGTAQYQVVNQLKLLKEQFNLSMILISHNLGILSHLADQIAVMYAGEIVEYGTKEEILTNPLHPYTKALIEAIPKGNGTISKGLGGVPPSFLEEITGCAFGARCPYCIKKCKEMEIHETYVSSSHKVKCIRMGDLM